MQSLTNAVRRYAWGTPDVIADLLGTEPDGDPQAELWVGAHPDSPSRLPDGSGLDELVATDPSGTLGPRVERSFGPRLPFLLKLLSAAAPLSLQVHPSQEQAEAGFAAEEAAGVPADAPHRRYRDPHHKPEMVVALTSFEALCGVRPIADVLADLSPLPVDHQRWRELLGVLERGPEGVAQRAVVQLLLGRADGVADLVSAVAVACAGSDGPSQTAVVDLARRFPGDAGVIVSTLLQRISLVPGEALHLPAGNVHAYLSGTGVEVMASSDNVLRAGLTPKHVDVDELVRLVDFTPRPVPRVVPVGEPGVLWYRPDVAEFELARVEPAGAPVEVGADGPRVLLVLAGDLDLGTGTGVLRATKGQSFFVAADEGPLSIAGSGVAVLAAVPQAREASR